MAPRKCVYYGCNNSSSEYSMFRFPINDKNRMEKWLASAGNMALSHLTENELSNRYICEAHFEASEIKKNTGFRPVLEKTAVPKSVESMASSPDLKVKTPTKVYKGKRKLELEKENLPTVDPEFGFQTPTKPKRRRISLDEKSKCVKQLQSTISYCTKKLKSKMISVKKLKNKLKNRDIINIEKFPFKSETSKTLTKMQLKRGNKKWTTAEKNLCLSWFYKSPSMYRHMRKTGVELAAPSTIKIWLKKASCFPGLAKVSFENIKKKFEHATDKEKSCIICFDEMAIMTCLEYNEKFDLIEGFEDLGKGHRTNKLAKNVLVFVARGLYHNWKIPLAYFLSHTNIKTESLKYIIKRVIRKTFESKLLVKAVVCDQGTTNVSALKQLGVTPDTPFFMVEDKKIFSIFDVPHIIKNLRNNLLTHNFIWNDNIISFKDIIDLYNIDKNNKSRSIKKITQAHVSPNPFQKMKVKLATQVFSHSVAAAMKTAVSTGELKSDTALNTAKFIEEINNLFDALNSRSLKHTNPYKRALTKKKNAVRKTLVNGINIMNNLKKITYKKDGTKIQTIPPSFAGMKQSIKAILNLFEEESKIGVMFIMTYRLNQDVIENLFGLYRMKTGCNRNPTAKQLRSVFRNNLLNGLITTSEGNCEEDQDKFILEEVDDADFSTSPINEKNCLEINEQSQTYLLDEPSTSTAHLQYIPQTKPSESESIQNTLEDGSIQNTLEDCSIQNTLEDCSIAYFAGYLARKCYEKYNCEECNKNFLSKDEIINDPHQLLILNKNYGIKELALKAPSATLFSMVKEALTIYCHVFENAKCKFNVRKLIITEIKKNIEINSCEEHCIYVLEKLVLVKIYDYCKTIKRSTQQSIDKIRILKNK